MLAAETDAKSVLIMPRLLPSNIANLLAASDVLLVHLKDEALFSITIPSKTQFYLAMGKPIIMGVRGDAADLVRRADAGVIVQPQDPNALANAVEHLASLPHEALAAMGERSFVVTIAYIKTEPIQVALFGFIFLGDKVTLPMGVAILVATAGVMALPMSRRDIADYLGLTLETVSRALSRLHELGILGFVGKSQRQIVLLDRPQLASLDLQH